MASNCLLSTKTFDRTEIPAIDLAIVAATRDQDLSDAIVSFELYEASATPRTAIDTWDNESGSGNNSLAIRHLERSRVTLTAIVNFGDFVPALEAGTRTLEYDLFCSFQGQRYKIAAGQFKVA